jgi:hypothetical protein
MVVAPKLIVKLGGLLTVPPARISPLNSNAVAKNATDRAEALRNLYISTIKAV